MAFNAFRDELQTFKAELQADLYAELGETIVFHHRTDSPVTLVCWPKGKSDTNSSRTLDLRSEIEKQDFIVPKQAGFTGQLDSGDTVDYQGDTFTVPEFTWDAFNAVVTMHAVLLTGLSIQA